jgi:hypothetical protein
MSYSPVLNRVYLAYDDGRMTKIDLATSHAEAAFSEFSAQLYDMVAADNQLYVDVGGPLGYTERFLCDSSGNIESRTGSPSFLDLAYWDSNQQAFFCTVTNGLGIEMLPVSGGTFGGAVDSSYSNDLSVGTGPIRFSGDGSLLVSGAGLVIASATLAQSGALSLPSVDSAWLGSDIFSADLSLSGTSVQQWVGPGYTAGNATALPGYPLRIWPTPGGGLIAMTDVNGTATMAVLDDSGNSVPFAPPVITIEPTNQTSSGGSTVVFSAAAKGSATYQWQFDGVNLSNGGSVSGATGPQLVLGNVTSANEGTYSCLVTGSSGSILTDMANLVVNTSATPGAVSSISSRAFVGTGDNILIGGFYVVGGTSRTVLVQAIGPALAADPYNVSGTLQHPKLSIHQNQNGQDVTLYSNTGWGPNPVLLGAAATAYAEPVLQPGSADSELLVTLPPGGYTAEVSGADGGTGVALVAIYQLP